VKKGAAARILSPESEEQPSSGASASWQERALQWIVFLTALAIPLIISPAGRDTFRLPKELAARAFAFVAGALLLSLLPGRDRWREFTMAKRELICVAAIAAWTIVSALCATNRTLAWEAVGTMVVAVVLFLAAFGTAGRNRSMLVPFGVVAAASLNAVVDLLQMAGWSPFPISEADPHLAQTALLGNPNDVGMTLVPATIAAVAIALAARGKTRSVAWALSALCAATLVLTQTVTAIVAGTVALIFFAPRQSRRVKLTVAATAAVTAMLLFAVVTPLRVRVLGMVAAAREGRYSDLSSSRVTPFLVAWEMTRDHPVTGVGPGGYRFGFFDYKLEVDRKYRKLMPERMNEWSIGRRSNFGETHNDWLQTAAETGLPGVALFAASLFLLARRKPWGSTDVAADFSARAALPLAVSLGVLALAQFPLRLAAPTILYVILAGSIVGWRSRDA
jgi:O-antigen ligase